MTELRMEPDSRAVLCGDKDFEQADVHMHPADSKALLEKAGTTQTAIASGVCGRSCKAVTRAAVHHVIRGLSHSQAIARHISKVVGEPVSRLWPGKYPDIEASEGRPRRAAKPVVAGRRAAP